MTCAESVPQWLVILRPPRETFPRDATPEEIEVVNAHLAHLARHCESGEVILAGRTQEEANPMGLVILRAPDREAAKQLMEADPAISRGLFSMELRPYKVALMGERIVNGE